MRMLKLFQVLFQSASRSGSGRDLRRDHGIRPEPARFDAHGLADGIRVGAEDLARRVLLDQGDHGSRVVFLIGEVAP